jgi:8-oxo-dGTP diphosphatase
LLGKGVEMAKEKMFHVGIKALVENEQGKVLLLHSPGWAKNKTPPHWDIPGGRIQEGQTIAEVLKREVEEETGISKVVESQFFSAVLARHQIPFEQYLLGLVLMIYKVKIPEGSKIVLSDEHTEYEWVEKNEAAKRLAEKYPEEFTASLAK